MTATTAQGRKPLSAAQLSVVSQLEKAGWTAVKMLADSMLMTRCRDKTLRAIGPPQYRLVSIDGKIYD